MSFGDQCEYQDVTSKIIDIHDKDKKYTCDLCGHQVSGKGPFKNYVIPLGGGGGGPQKIT